MPTSVAAAIAGAVVSDYVAGYVVAEFAFSAMAGKIAGALVGGLASSTIGAAFSDSPDAGPSERGFSQELRANLVTVRQPISYWQYIYGRSRVSGALTFAHEAADKRLHIIVTFAGHVSEEIEAIQFNDELVTIDGAGLGTGKWENRIRIQKSLGDEAGQPFPDLVAESEGKWTEAHRQSGRTKIYVRLTFNADTFPTGLPNVTAIIKGRKVYDQRTGLTVWSDNASLCIADFLCDTRAGLGCVYADEIDETQLIAAANIDDEAVALAAGGTEARYTLNGAFLVNAEPRAVLGKLLTANAGKAVYIGGVWRIHPAAYVAPTITLTESDCRAVPHISPRLSASDLANAVKGLYVNEDNLWQPSDFPPITNATYLAEDNNERSWRELDLPYTKSAATAQRIAKIELEKVRQQISLDWPGKFTCYRLQPGDTVRLTFSMLGWSEKIFEVVQSGLVLEDDGAGARLGCDLSLRETAAMVFDWASGEETAVDPAPDTNLPDPLNVAAPALPALDSSADQIVRGGDGTLVSRIEVTLAAPGNPFVRWVTVRFKKTADADWQTAAPFGPETLVTWLSPVEDGEDYDVAVRYENEMGVRSDWTQCPVHTVIGKSALPGTIPWATLSGDVIRWGLTAEQDLAGAVWRWQPGASVSWGDANALHDGLIQSPYTLINKPLGQVTLLGKLVDVVGNESLVAATISTDFGDPVLANVIQTVDCHANGFTGTITDGTVDGGTGDLLADTEASPAAWTDDLAAAWTADSDPAWDASTYKLMTYVDVIYVDAADAGAQLTVASDITAVTYGIEYRRDGAGAAWTDDLDPAWTGDTDPAWDTESWQTWPGAIAAEALGYEFRVTTGAGNVQGQIAALALQLDVADVTETLADVALASGGTRLPITKTYRTIKAVNLTLQADGGSARSVEVIDKNATLGPTCRGFDSTHTGTAATVDAIVQGY